MLHEILLHFLDCMREEPVGTAALFILPLWVPSDFMSLVHGMPHVFRIVERYERGSELFTAPAPVHRGGARRYLGPTRWPVVCNYPTPVVTAWVGAVVAVWVGPEAVPGL
jgi:hypothetical protein